MDIIALLQQRSEIRGIIFDLLSGKDFYEIEKEYKQDILNLLKELEELGVKFTCTKIKPQSTFRSEYYTTKIELTSK